MVARRPKVSSQRGITRVTKSEFVSDVTLWEDFVLTSKPINPGDQEVFQWLANQALSYEYYKLVSLVFRFVPEAPTTLAGRIVLGFDYDVTDTSPPDEITLMNLEGSVYGPPWTGLDFRVNPAKFHGENKWLYTRPHNTRALRTTDGGKFMMCARGAEGTQCGALFMDYTFDLKIPQVPKVVPVVPSNYAFREDVDPEIVVSGETAYVRYQTERVNTLDMKYNPITREFTLPPGTYRIKTAVTGTYQGTSQEAIAMELKCNSQGCVPVVDQRPSTTGTDRDDVITLNWSGWLYSDGVTPIAIEAKLTFLGIGTFVYIARAVLEVYRAQRTTNLLV
jgi:hypothetical protein